MTAQAAKTSHASLHGQTERREPVILRILCDELRPYGHGDLAGFPEDQARVLVRQGLAEAIEEPMQAWLMDDGA